jgi:L-threonylcarbamoyladenylate synthase
VIRECSFPLAAPSANPANQLSPTNAAHVSRYFGEEIPLIVDGGQSQVGIESTVVDITVSPPRLLRPGMIHEEALMAVTGGLVSGPVEGGEVLRSPGLLKKHYSPRAEMVIWSWTNDGDLRRKAATLEAPLERIHVIAHTTIPSIEGFGRVSVIPHDAEAFGRAIYAELHHCDELGAAVIIVESLPSSSEWRGIADRLKRAAAS